MVLPRQVWHLALADGLSSVVDIAYLLTSRVVGTSPENMWMLLDLMDLGLFTSLTLELHVAAGVAALYWRSRRAMRLLSSSVWLCWVPGLVGSVLDLTDVSCEHESMCVKVEGFVMLGASCMTCCLYLLSALRALWYPGQQERRAHTMVCLYVVSFVVTVLPFQLHSTIVLQKTLSHISIVLLRFNGVSNVLTYALNSQMARSTVLAPDVLDDRGPRDNEFVHWAGASNVRVGFDFWEHEEHLVARVQRVALRRSEHETASLEVVRDDSDA